MENNEQLQWLQVKQWFQKNAVYIITLVVLTFGGSSGWNYWKDSQFKHKSAASDLYQEVIDLSADGNLNDARSTLTQLEKNYIDTAYPFLGNLQLAKSAFSNENSTMAKESLQWIVINSQDEILIYAATDRLVRILMDENQPDKVAEIINDALGKISNQSSVSSLNMALGDAYLQQKNIDLARSSYQIAKRNLSSNSTLKELIDMKLRDISSL